MQKKYGEPIGETVEADLIRHAGARHRAQKVWFLGLGASARGAWWRTATSSATASPPRR